MKYIISIAMILMVLPTNLFGMYTTLFKPTYWSEKPRFDRNNMTSYEFTYSYGWSDQSFGPNGKKTSLISFHNPEPLIPSFVYPDISKKDDKPIGYALFDGNYSVNTVHNEFIQNIYKHLFIKANIPLAHSHLKNITITPTNQCGDKIIPNQSISQYLQDLSTKLFDSGPHEQSLIYLGPTFLFFGYARSFNHFTHIDLLDLELSSGLVFPIKTLEEPDVNLFPSFEVYNFGIPLEIKVLLGMYDWLNVGFASACILLFNHTRPVAINADNPYPNKLLLEKTILATVNHYPFVSCTAYIEGEQFLPHWTWYFGFSYVKHFKTTWDICSDPKATSTANNFPTVLPWSQGSIVISSEFDFSSVEKKCMPRCKLVYAKRLFGKNCLDTSLVAGQVGFEILYDF